jgi:hypothetical protein
MRLGTSIEPTSPISRQFHDVARARHTLFRSQSSPRLKSQQLPFVLSGVRIAIDGRRLFASDQHDLLEISWLMFP